MQTIETPEKALAAPPLAVALKEWAVTCQALAEGRQIVLLRKGGILDEDGVFALEHARFWLQPTYLHQDTTLVQSQHRDLFEKSKPERGENRDFLRVRYFAEVSDVFALREDDEEKLRATSHIWSANYLDLRFGYKPQHPLLCVALRVYDGGEYSRLPMRDEWTGCRSWLDLGDPLLTGAARPVLTDEDFAVQRADLRRILTA